MMFSNNTKMQNVIHRLLSFNPIHWKADFTCSMIGMFTFSVVSKDKPKPATDTVVLHNTMNIYLISKYIVEKLEYKQN